MKAELTFETKKMFISDLGSEASVPDLAGGLILQNNLGFHLEEDDEIFQGYGRVKNSFPYRQFNCYNRKLEKREIKTAVLENDFLRAVFLPEFGGRLWELWDKKKNRNLLYTNDVLRFSNLAVRNAWFSGGVEWNAGVIGHSPFTTAPLFTAVAQKDDGIPVLRMYEYERIRGIVWQMDFWLEENGRFLNARMRLVNETNEVIPMYWWSNMAVPEYENGRIVVAAQKAYTFRNGGVYKVDIPMVDGADITRYENIPVSVDYFFEIPAESPKYIAHMDGEGYGVLQMSTARQQARKLFSWGHKPGADRWQSYLTKDAGRYVEIQSGLPKTQYGCLPMAPRTAWEWLERYGAFEETGQQEEFGALRDKVSEKIAKMPEYREMEKVLVQTKEMAKQPVRRIFDGSGYGALERSVREAENLRLCQETGQGVQSDGHRAELSPHLDFGVMGETQKHWLEFWESGILHEPDPEEAPEDFMVGQRWFARLLETMDGNRENWYAWYQLGLFYYRDGVTKKAEEAFRASFECRKNVWALHALAWLLYESGYAEEAAEAMAKGIGGRAGDLSYGKDGFRLLSLCGAWERMLVCWEILPGSVRAEARMRFFRVRALLETGRAREAEALFLDGDGGYVIPDDVREGEDSVGKLWKDLQRALGKEAGHVPAELDFAAG